MPWAIESPRTTQSGPVRASSVRLRSSQCAAYGSICCCTRRIPGTNRDTAVMIRPGGRPVRLEKTGSPVSATAPVKQVPRRR